MYLTTLNNMYGDIYSIHKKVREFFPEDIFGKILYQHLGSVVLVLTKIKPKINTTDICLDLKDGDTLPFSLRFYPRKKSKLSGKQSGLENIKDIRGWLDAKAVQNGFKLEYVTFQDEGIVTVNQKSKNNIIKLKSVFCNGVLTITNSDIFKVGLLEGIGAKSGFGFGMLNVFY
jgi:CRISPR-associated protein Cas6/Cse3/CasE subtype I-E